MTDARSILDKLAAPFAPDSLSWRVGSTTSDKSKGMALAYIDARDVQRRLDEVMGADWQCEYVPMANGTCCCRIGLKIDGEWRWRSNGAGATDIEGDKGQYSDGFKRAAVMWGIGAYLYDTPSPWVELEQKGRSQIIKPGQEAKLRAALVRASGPQRQEAPTPQEAARERLTQGIGETLVGHVSSAREAAARHTAAAVAVSRGAPAVEAPPVKSEASARMRRQMIEGLDACYIAKQLASWKKDNGKASGKWDVLDADDKAAVLAKLKAREAIVAPKGAADPQAPLQ